MLTVDWRLALTAELPTFFGVMIAVCLEAPGALIETMPEGSDQLIGTVASAGLRTA